MVGIVIESAKSSNSEKNYIKNFLKNWFDIDLDRVRFYQMSGKSELLKKTHPNYKIMAQEKLKKVLFILDADDDYEKTQKDIKNLIDNLDIDTKMNYFISCNPETKKGAIEDLLLSALESEKLKHCYEKFIFCIDNIEYNPKTLYKKMCDITKGSPIDFEHKNLQELKNKLKWLIGV